MTTNGMSLQHAADLIAKHKRTILGVFAFTVVLSVGLTLLPAETYYAESRVVINESAAQDILDLGTESRLLTRQVFNELTFAKGDDVLGELENFAGQRLAEDVRVRSDLVSDLIRFEVVAASPELAAERANMFAELYVAARRNAVLENIEDAIIRLEERLAISHGERSEIVAPITELEVQRQLAPASDIPALDREIARLYLELDAELALVDSQVEFYSDSLSALQVGGDVASVGAARITLTADPPESGSHARLGRNLFLALVGGVALSALATALLESTDNKIRTRQDVLEIAPVGIVAEIPRVGRGYGAKELASASLNSSNFVSGAYDRVRLALQHAIEAQSLDMMSVTSPTPGKGATTTALNLAACLASAGVKTSVVEANFRNPAFNQLLADNLDSQFGNHAPSPYERRQFDHLGWHPSMTLSNLTVMSAGDVQMDPLSVVRSDQMGDLLNSVAGASDVTLIDGPPVLRLPDGLQLAQLVPNSLLVLRAGHSKKADLTAALKSFEQTGTSVVAIVLVGSYVYKERSSRAGLGSMLKKLDR